MSQAKGQKSINIFRSGRKWSEPQCWPFIPFEIGNLKTYIDLAKPKSGAAKNKLVFVSQK